jgi:ubiquinone/menaquinone biosynthesis C-methylase UbiE
VSKPPRIEYSYDMQAAPADAWRVYDPVDPDPGYYQFDWISARHPDLYHQYAVTSVGLMEQLARLVDLSGLDVLDVGAGTGHSTIGAARKARHVTAVDAYRSVVEFGRSAVREAGLTNVTYVVGDRSNLPVPSGSMDVVICVWAELDHREAARVLKHGGVLAHLGPAPGNPKGELSATLAGLPTRGDITPLADLEPTRPSESTVIQQEQWAGVPIQGGVHRHEFSYVADYGTVENAAAIHGRVIGPIAAKYLTDRAQATIRWRLMAEYARVNKKARSTIDR